MKLLLHILLISCSIAARAQWIGAAGEASKVVEAITADWYISPNGDGTDGLTPATAFNDITDINAETLSPGDVVAFERGYQYHGNLIVNYSGTAGNPIKFTAYGTGEKPIITNKEDITLSSLGSNIWYAINVDPIYQVFRDNVRTQNAKSIKYGIDTVKSTTSFVDVELIGHYDITGTTIFFYSGYFLAYANVTDFNSLTGLVTIDNSPHYGLAINKEFEIVNDIHELKKQDDWAYRNDTLYVYSSSEPINVEISAGESVGISLNSANYVTLNNLKIDGYNLYGIYSSTCSDLTVNNCVVSNNYNSGVFIFGTGERIDIDNCEINNSMRHGISLSNDYSTITNNIVSDVGMESYYTYYETYSGTNIRTDGDSTIIDNNVIYNCGYNGINFGGIYTEVIHNYISQFTQFLIDGAAIYTYTGSTGGVWNTPKSQYAKVWNNTIIGSDITRDRVAFGVYLDDCSTDVDVQFNNIYKCADGIYFHNNKRCTASNNVLFENNTGITLREEPNGDSEGGLSDNDGEMVDNVVSGNKIYRSYALGRGSAITLHSHYGNIGMYTGTNNKIHSEGTLHMFHYLMTPVDIGYTTEMTLAQFQSATGNEIGTTVNSAIRDVYTVDSYNTSNTLPNNTFDSGTTGWTGSNGSIANNGGYLSFMPTVSSVGSSITQTSNNTPIVGDSIYEFTFEIRSTTDHPLGFKIQNMSPDYENTGIIYNLHPTTSFSTIKRLFKPSFDSPGARLTIHDSGDTGFDLSAVSLRQVTLGTPPQNGFLAYNETSNSKYVTLPTGSWITMDSIAYVGTINIPAYSSIILIKLPDVVVADYYVSPNGDGTDGLTPATAFNDITDINAETLSPGDVVAFERGYQYHGNLIVNYSGTAGNPIKFTAYGTGEKPEITGLYTVPTWDLSGYVYTSSAAVSTLTSCNVVLIDGVITPKGKTPNTGFFTIDSHSGHASLTSADLSGVTINTNMQVLTKPDRWILNVSPVSGVSGTTINTSLSTAYDHHDGWGFWLQNDVACLDVNNENSYNSSTKLLSVYHEGSLPTVQVGNITNLVEIVGHDYIEFENLRFTGADSAAFFLKNAKNVSIDNCEIEHCFDGIRGQKPSGTTGDPLDSHGFSANVSTIKKLLNCGIWLDEDFGNATLDSLVMDSIGMWHGMGGSGDGTYSAVRVMGDSLTLTYSSITHTGYNPVSLDGVGTVIQRNLIDGFNLVKDDGAGLYLARQNTGRILDENIVLNGIGTTFFLPSTSYDDPWEVLRAKGIYLDDDAQYVTVTNNTVFNVVDNGLFLHGNHGDHTITGNLMANCRGWNGIFSIAQDDPTADMSNVSFQDNILVAYASGQRVASAITDPALTLTGYGTFANNYYVSPLDAYAIMNYDTDMTAGSSTNTNLAGWQTAISNDATSTDPLISVADTSEIFFDYNWSASVKVSTLPAGTWEDVDGTTHSGTVNVPAWRSVILFKQ